MTNIATGDPKAEAPQLFIPAGCKGPGQPPLYTAAQVEALSAARAADTDVLDAAMRAIQQAIQLIGEPTDERMRTVRRVLRGAVVVADDAAAPRPSPSPAPAQPGQEGEPVLDTAATIASLQKRAAHLEKQLAKALAAPQPATADAVDALSNEQWRAIRDAYESAGTESYFEARPQIDCIDRRRVFTAGFGRGWDAALAAQREVKP